METSRIPYPCASSPWYGQLLVWSERPYNQLTPTPKTNESVEVPNWSPMAGMGSRRKTGRDNKMPPALEKAASGHTVLLAL